MSNTIIELRHSSVTGNVPSSLANGEIAINTFDGKLFYRGGVSNTIQTIERYEGPAGLDGEVQFNDSGVLGSDSGFTYNKTTDIITIVGGAIVDGINVAPQIQSAFNQANSVYLPSVTRLDVTNSGSAAYLFDQYSGNNPELFIRAGETLAFSLNVVGHPFLIRVSSGGTQYSNGLTHVSNTGTVLTGANAQAQVAGTLYWKVPAELAGNTYVYQCQVHGGMVGNIIIERPNQANSAASYANSAFLAANTPSHVANSAAIYANGAFAAANAATATDATQNNSITAAFIRANNSINANTGGTITGNLTITGNISTSGNLAVTGNTTFSKGFRALGSVNSIGDLVSNSSFNGISTRSLNLVGTSAVLRVARTNVTGDPAVELLALNPNTAATLSHWDFYVGGTTDTFSLRRRTGGAEQIILVANNTLANITTNVRVTGGLTSSNLTSQSFIQFGDGTRQFTANAGTGGGGTTDQYARDTANAAFIHANSAFDAANTGGGGSANSFGQVVANVGTILATSANDSIEFIGESGISVSSNVSAKKVIVSVPAGFTFTTADYGFVYDSTNVIYDYGTL
jgi:hypothetical protein